ncbi:hypothetical protein ACFE04_013887 [Oxalis oulophora]
MVQQLMKLHVVSLRESNTLQGPAEVVPHNEFHFLKNTTAEPAPSATSQPPLNSSRPAYSEWNHIPEPANYQVAALSDSIEKSGSYMNAIEEEEEEEEGTFNSTFLYISQNAVEDMTGVQNAVEAGSTHVAGRASMYSILNHLPSLFETIHTFKEEGVGVVEATTQKLRGGDMSLAAMDRMEVTKTTPGQEDQEMVT